MITVKLFDKYDNLLLKTHKAEEERLEVSFYKYSTADHYVMIDEETDQQVRDGKVIPVIVL